MLVYVSCSLDVAGKFLTVATALECLPRWLSVSGQLSWISQRLIDSMQSLQTRRLRCSFFHAAALLVWCPCCCDHFGFLSRNRCIFGMVSVLSTHDWSAVILAATVLADVPCYLDDSGELSLLSEVFQALLPSVAVGQHFLPS